MIKKRFSIGQTFAGYVEEMCGGKQREQEEMTSLYIISALLGYIKDVSKAELLHGERG